MLTTYLANSVFHLRSLENLAETQQAAIDQLGSQSDLLLAALNGAKFEIADLFVVDTLSHIGLHGSSEAIREASNGFGMAGTSVYASFNGGRSMLPGTEERGEYLGDAAKSAAQAVGFAGRLSGATWALEGIPGVNLAINTYDVGKIGVKSGLAYADASYNNAEIDRMREALAFTDAQMDLTIGDIKDIEDLMQRYGCK